MEDSKIKGSRKRKMKIEKKDSTQSASKIPRRQTRSTAVTVVAESVQTDRKKWTMYQGYDKIKNKKLLKSIRSEEFNDMVEVELPPKLMDVTEIPATGKITTYSRTNYLQTITMVLHDSPAYDVLVNSNLFSVFKIPMKKCCVSGRLLHNMLGRMLLTRKNYEMWFLLGNRPIKYSLREFALVTGLDCGPYPMTEEEWDALETKGSGEEGYWWELFGPLNLTSGVIKDIEKFLLKDFAKPAGKRISHERRLRLCLIVLVDGVLCCKNCAAVKASPTTVELSRDIDKFLKFPWGRLAFELTLEMVRVGTSSNPSVAKFVDRYTGTHVPIKGFTIAFQLVFLKAIPALNNHLSQPKLDTNYADPKLKAKDIKEWREITNDIIERLDNDAETDIYTTVTHGFQLVNSNLSWDDEVEDTSVDLMETLLAEAYVFKSTDWVKGRVDTIEEKIISRFGKSERVPTKKVQEAAVRGRASGIPKEEITEISGEEGEEPFKGYGVVMGEIVEIIDDCHLDNWNYIEMNRKEMYKKINRVLKKHKINVPDLSGDKVKQTSIGSLRLNDSESGSENHRGSEDLPDLRKRKSKEIVESSNSSTGEEQSKEVFQSVVRPNMLGARNFGLAESVGRVVDDAGVVDVDDAGVGSKSNVRKNEKMVNKGNFEVENVKVGGSTVGKESGGDEGGVTKDSCENEGERNVEGSGPEADEVRKELVEEEGKITVEESLAVKPDVRKENIEGESERNAERVSKLERKADDGKDPKQKKEFDKAKDIGVEIVETTITAGGNDVKNLGFEPISDELKNAFMKKLSSYVQQFYMINADMYHRSVFEDIYQPGINLTNEKVIGLLVDTIWERLRPTMEPKRVIMYGPLFSSLLVSEFTRLKDYSAKHPKAGSETQFLWSTTLGNYMKGTSSSRPGNNKWFVSVDRIYAPMIWIEKNHCVGLCIDLVKCTVSVFDCLKDQTNTEELEELLNPILSMLPLLIEGFINSTKVDVKRPKYFKYGRPVVSQDPGSGNSAMLSLKFMEMHAQGLSLQGITEEMVANFRMNYAIEFYQRQVMPIQLS